MADQDEAAGFIAEAKQLGEEAGALNDTHIDALGTCREVLNGIKERLEQIANELNGLKDQPAKIEQICKEAYDKAYNADQTQRWQETRDAMFYFSTSATHEQAADQIIHRAASDAEAAAKRVGELEENLQILYYGGRGVNTYLAQAQENLDVMERKLAD